MTMERNWPCFFGTSLLSDSSNKQDVGRISIFVKAWFGPCPCLVRMVGSHFFGAYSGVIYSEPQCTVRFYQLAGQGTCCEDIARRIALVNPSKGSPVKGPP